MTRRFSSVLVANRGEIACRIIRTLRAEGYRAIAVYSDADAGAPHTAIADESVHIGPAPAAESYLDIARIIEAAKRSAAGAIHPGYGFLSENPAFAEACATAGIVFIGPSPDAIRAMGGKAEAKRLMIAAGVPCVPGYQGESQDDAVLAAEALRIGFPVLLKASAGGGGRGMRRVDHERALPEALAGARSEAKSAFGSDALIVEKLIERARHVEIQVIADAYGNCIHLGERDCSIQRRHQKIIEESPCPVMTPELRAAMGASAVAAAKSVNYTGAGTVEFLLDEGGHFYFLEMNTRLQVEHPVTEMITGLDLVAIQLAVAQGETLPVAQEEVRFLGHAIEARLYCEDPAQGFLPQTGTLLAWEPAIGAGVRVDHGIREGSIISPYYDPMVAKIIAHGASRTEAVHRLEAALERTLLLGVKSNRALLLACIRHEAFADGRATTAFLDEYEVLRETGSRDDNVALLAAAMVFIEHAARSVPPSLKGWRSTGPVTVPLKLEHAGTAHQLFVQMSRNTYEIDFGREKIEGIVRQFSDNFIRYEIAGRVLSARYALNANDLWLDSAGRIDVFADITYSPPADAGALRDGVLKAPMGGKIVRLGAKPGDRVEKDQVLVVLEAMKMENQITAPHGGTLTSVYVAVGDQVNANQILAELAE